MGDLSWSASRSPNFGGEMTFAGIADASASTGSGTDQTAAILAAINDAAARGQTLVIPKGDFLIKDLTVTGDLRLKMKGRFVIPAGYAGLIVRPSGWSAEIAITGIADQAIQAVNVSRITADISGLSPAMKPGDIVKIMSDDATSHNANIIKAEMYEVRRTDGSTYFDLSEKIKVAFTTNPVFRRMPKAVCDIDGRSCAGGNYENTAITGAVNRQPSLQVFSSYRPRIRWRSDSSWERVVELSSVWMGEVDVEAAEAPDRASATAYGYGVAIMNGSKGVSVRSRTNRVRHCVTGGGFGWGIASINKSHYEQCGPVVAPFIHDCIAIGSDSGGYDIHDPVYFAVMDNCHNYSPSQDPLASDSTKTVAFNIRGYRAVIRNCSAVGPSGEAIDEAVHDYSGLYDWSQFTPPHGNIYQGFYSENADTAIRFDGDATFSATNRHVVKSLVARNYDDGVNHYGVNATSGYTGRLLVDEPTFLSIATPLRIDAACDVTLSGGEIDFKSCSQTQAPIVSSISSGTLTVRFNGMTIRGQSGSTPAGIIRTLGAGGATTIWPVRITATFAFRSGTLPRSRPTRSTTCRGIRRQSTWSASPLRPPPA